MSDGRKNNPNMGGVRSGAGRPTKIKEENVLETINLYIDQHEAILLLKELMFDDKNLKKYIKYSKFKVFLVLISTSFHYPAQQV